jgi:hypothetical protein
LRAIESLTKTGPSKTDQSSIKGLGKDRNKEPPAFCRRLYISLTKE